MYIPVAARTVVPDAAVAPCLSLNENHSRFVADITKAYFVPLCLCQADLAGIHGVYQHSSVAAYQDVDHGYRAIIGAIDATEDDSFTPQTSPEAST